MERLGLEVARPGNDMERLEIELQRLGIGPATGFHDQTRHYDNIKKALVCGYFMQVAHQAGKKGSYVIVKDNQVSNRMIPQRFNRDFPLTCVITFSISDQASVLHPSCVLNPKTEWVLYNEFVLTTRAYIRTVTGIRPEWLLELATDYYDLASFPKGKVKQTLLRVLMKQTGKNAEGSSKLPKNIIKRR